MRSPVHRNFSPAARGFGALDARSYSTDDCMDPNNTDRYILYHMAQTSSYLYMYKKEQCVRYGPPVVNANPYGAACHH